MGLSRFRKRGVSTALSMATLALVLLASQHIAFQHELDLDSHAPDQICEVCITVAGLDGADVGQAQVSMTFADVPRLPDYQPAIRSEALLKHRFARGPPATS